MEENCVNMELAYVPAHFVVYSVICLS